jgi:hypothetical protein
MHEVTHVSLAVAIVQHAPSSTYPVDLTYSFTGYLLLLPGNHAQLPCASRCCIV